MNRPFLKRAESLEFCRSTLMRLPPIRASVACMATAICLVPLPCAQTQGSRTRIWPVFGANPSNFTYLCWVLPNYYPISFLDEYSRYIMDQELLWSTDGHTVSVAAEAALETLPRDE